MNYKKLVSIVAFTSLLTSASAAVSPPTVSAYIPYEIQLTLEGPYLVRSDGRNETEVGLGNTVNYFFFNYQTQDEDEFLNDKAIFTSSNPSVGVIDQYGNFTALDVGTTTITATSDNLIATVTVTVPEPRDISFSLVQKIDLDENTVVELNDNVVRIGESFPYQVYAVSVDGYIPLPKDLFSISSSNPEVIKIVDGKLVAISTGTSLIKVEIGYVTREFEYHVPVPMPEPTTDKTLLQQIDEAVHYINDIREKLGIRPLTFNMNMHQAAQAHANYIRVNGYWGLHDEFVEDQNFFGMTVFDRLRYTDYHPYPMKTGEVMSFSSADPLIGMKDLIDAPIHRKSLIDPAYKDIGVANNTVGKNIAVVADLASITVDEKDLLPIVLYPYNNQTDISRYWINSEIPNPLAEYPEAPRVVGYPITISSSTSKKSKLKTISAMITDDSGKSVDFYLTQGSTYTILIPKKLLNYETKYNVTYRGQFEGEEEFERKWSFTTETEDFTPGIYLDPETLQLKYKAPPREFSKDDVGVRLNGKYIELNPKAKVINGNTLIPLRGVFEAMNATVKWDGSKQQVTITKGDTKVLLTIGEKIATVNNKQVNISIAPFVSAENSTYVPLRFVSEALGAKVEWEAKHWTAVIDQK